MRWSGGVKIKGHGDSNYTVIRSPEHNVGSRQDISRSTHEDKMKKDGKTSSGFGDAYTVDTRTKTHAEHDWVLS